MKFDLVMIMNDDKKPLVISNDNKPIVNFLDENIVRKLKQYDNLEKAEITRQWLELKVTGFKFKIFEN
jgi:hypothetical protein